MGKFIETAAKAETCVLVGLVTEKQSRSEVEEYLDELAFLAETAKAKTQKRYIQSLRHADPKTFVGSGKLQEIKEFVLENEIDMLIFDDELSPSQLRNLEKEFLDKNVKILDRSNLILDIFASRARTAHAKTQVELAQYEYLLPRLTRMWTHLSKQKGGIGMKGPGEKEIETDRRIIRDKIARLKEQLKLIDKQKATQRSNRGAMVRVALVGYTNVGKSTLMNLLSKSKVFAEDKLFATLDTTVRKVVLGNLPFLLSDTVGFIRKLPHQLIESFKSTLDETREADILMHVIDISHSQFQEHMEIVNETLQDIGSLDKPTVLVFNKIDRVPRSKEVEFEYEMDDEPITVEALKKTWMAQEKDMKVVFVSATKKENIQELRDILYQEVKAIHIQRYPYNDFLF